MHTVCRIKQLHGSGLNVHASSEMRPLTKAVGSKDPSHIVTHHIVHFLHLSPRHRFTRTASCAFCLSLPSHGCMPISRLICWSWTLPSAPTLNMLTGSLAEQNTVSFALNWYKVQTHLCLVFRNGITYKRRHELNFYVFVYIIIWEKLTAICVLARKTILC